MCVLGTPDADLYDWPGAGTDEGDALVTDGVRPGYREVAANLRARILSGEYAPGTAIPGQLALSREFEADVAVVNRAFGELAREGLVEMAGRGRRTVVLAQRRWHVEVTVRLAADVEGARPLPAALSDAADSEPGVELALLRPAFIPSTHDIPGYPVLIAEMTAVASDVDIAVTRAWGLVRDALRVDGGWDLDEPRVTARPA